LSTGLWREYSRQYLPAGTMLALGLYRLDEETKAYSLVGESNSIRLE
jgi:hypothetical protein